MAEVPTPKHDNQLSSQRNANQFEQLRGVEDFVTYHVVNGALNEQYGPIINCLSPFYIDEIAVSWESPVVVQNVGNWDASTGSFPVGAFVGNRYTVSVAGDVEGITYNVGESITAIINDPSPTTLKGNWAWKADATIVVPGIGFLIVDGTALTSRNLRWKQIIEGINKQNPNISAGVVLNVPNGVTQPGTENRVFIFEPYGPPQVNTVNRYEHVKLSPVGEEADFAGFRNLTVTIRIIRQIN